MKTSDDMHLWDYYGNHDSKSGLTYYEAPFAITNALDLKLIR